MIVFSENKDIALNSNNVLYYATSRPSANGVCDLTAYIGGGESVQLAKGQKEELQAIIKEIAIADTNGQETYTVSVSGTTGAMAEEVLKKNTKYVVPVNGGELIVCSASDSNYPGVYVDFRPQGQEYEHSLALVEAPYSEDCVKFHLWESTETDDTTYDSDTELSAFRETEAAS